MPTRRRFARALFANSFKDMVEVGWRPVGLMVAETAWIAALILICVEFLL